MSSFLSQLPPEVLKQFLTDPNAKYVDPATGYTYYPDWTGATQGNDQNASLPGQYTGRNIGVSDISGKSGQFVPMALYDNGGFVGEGMTGHKRDFGDILGPALAAIVLGGGAYSALGGAGAGAGAANGSWDVLPAAAGGADTASMGAAGAGGIGGAGGSGAGVTGLGDAGTMYAGADSTAAGTLGGGASINGGAALGTTGLTSGVTSGLLDGAGKLLGPAATLLGAAAGGQGQKTNEQTQRDIPEWLKPYVTGQGGLLDAASTQFKNQIASGMPGYQSMANVGMNLLSQPIAGNGFNKFYKG